MSPKLRDLCECGHAFAAHCSPQFPNGGPCMIARCDACTAFSSGRTHRNPDDMNGDGGLIAFSLDDVATVLRWADDAFRYGMWLGGHDQELARRLQAWEARHIEARHSEATP